MRIRYWSSDVCSSDLFPWAASGRAIGIDRTEGFTKLIFDEETHRIVGAGIVGVHAGDLISELALAIEMGSEAADIAPTVHPHPTLGESVGMAPEAYEGTLPDLYIQKNKRGCRRQGWFCRSTEHTYDLQSLIRQPYAVFISK